MGVTQRSRGAQLQPRFKQLLDSPEIERLVADLEGDSLDWPAWASVRSLASIARQHPWGQPWGRHGDKTDPL